MTEHHSCFARMFGFCGSWFPGYAQGLGRKCRAVLQQVKRAPGHMIISTPPCSSLPFSLFPHYYQNVKKAYYSYCQGNYLLFQIQRGVWHNFHDHSCCCLKKNETQCLVCPPPPPRTDSIINGPASSYYFTSFYIYHAGAPAKPQGCHILNNVAFLYPTPQTLALDSGRDTHAHTHSKEGNGHCQENRSQRKWLRDEHQKGQSQDTLEKRKKGSCVFMFVCRRKPA